MKSLHLTLAYQFQSEHFETLKQLAENMIDTNLQAFWEVRLYSRDSRVAGKKVFEFIFKIYLAMYFFLHFFYEVYYYYYCYYFLKGVQSSIFLFTERI